MFSASTYAPSSRSRRLSIMSEFGQDIHGEYQIREACDRCHHRKVRCNRNPSASDCVSCQYNGHSCTYSPRSKMGRPRATRSVSEHNIKDTSVPYHPDLVPDLSLQYAFSDPANDPDQAWLSPTETYHSFDMAAGQITTEKKSHFSHATNIVE